MPGLNLNCNFSCLLNRLMLWQPTNSTEFMLLKLKGFQINSQIINYLHVLVLQPRNAPHSMSILFYVYAYPFSLKSFCCLATSLASLALFCLWNFQTSVYLYSYFHPPAFVQLMSSAARQLQRSLETCVFHTAAWRELHPHGGRPDEARPHPATRQRHKGTHFWGLRLTWLGGQTSVPR